MSIVLPCNISCGVYVLRLRPLLLSDFQSQLYPRSSKYLRACEIYRTGASAHASTIWRSAPVEPAVASLCSRRVRTLDHKFVRESVSNVCSARILESRTFSRERWIRLDLHGEMSRQDHRTERVLNRRRQPRKSKKRRWNEVRIY